MLYTKMVSHGRHDIEHRRTEHYGQQFPAHLADENTPRGSSKREIFDYCTITKNEEPDISEPVHTTGKEEPPNQPLQDADTSNGGEDAQPSPQVAVTETV